MRHVVVVGAGAAGIIAAWRAASLGARVTLLEKTPRIGTKILISGGGKCNITHDGPIEDLLRAFRPNEARFIRPACYRFTNTQIVDMLTSRGLSVYTRPDGRIFPIDATAKDVVAILKTYLDEALIHLRLQTPGAGLMVEGGRVVGIRTDREALRADAVILSAGGSSYPNSGTTGDAWPWVKQLGHTIVEVKAALAPMDVKMPFQSPSGVALRDCALRARKNGKELARWRGDMLFTHHGVTGPNALGISREVAERSGGVALEVDIIPALSQEAISEQIIEVCKQHPRRSIASFVSSLVAQSLVSPILASANVASDVIGANFDKAARNRLVSCLKAWPIGTVTRVPIEKGEVVAGGVALDEVDPHTMRSRKADGLFLCGEMLDIAGPVGGYNLQAAFATGYVAGESATQG